MNDHGSHDVSERELDFNSRDHAGSVLVRMWANHDPERSGHGLVAPDFDADKFRGFPMTLAEVRYPVVGPRAIFYWLQVISFTGLDGGTTSQVDAFGDFFYAVGHAPTFMDAPANPHHRDMDWIARTFLVEAPSVIATDRVDRLVGFTWGYRVEGGRPTRLIGPELASDGDWNLVRATYRDERPFLRLGDRPDR